MNNKKIIPTLKKFRFIKICVKRPPYSQLNKLFVKVIYWTFSPEISRYVLISVITYVLKGVFFFKFGVEVGVEESTVNEPFVLKTDTTEKVTLDLNG
jgi:hypothetical protein